MDPRLKALDDLRLDDLDDFDSEDLEEAAGEPDEERNAYIGGMWDRYGYAAATGASRGQDRTAALVTAQQMCQTFVDTFAGGGRRYRVTFDPRVGIAGTDLEGLAVAITPAPIFDDTLTPQQAGVLLTAMSTHEVSHDRYGRSTALAVHRVFGRKRAPNMLSNILDDVRIERRFAAEYPGYRDVFRPMLDYVGAAARTKGAPPPSMDDLVNLCCAAVRYAPYVRWTKATAAERDWWQAWADRWAVHDAPRRHVEGVREGLRRIVAHRLAKAKRLADAPQPRAGSPAARIKGALADLPPVVQKAMRMTAEGRTGAEVAAALGLSIEDAKVLIRGGRKHLAGVG